MKRYWDYKAKGDPFEASDRIYRDGRLDADVLSAICLDIETKLGLSSEDVFLDAGCGSMLLYNRIKGKVAYAAGIDFSLPILMNFGDRNRIVCGELLSLPFAANSFDKILSSSVFQYFPDLDYAEKSFYELVRVCKPGGRILIGDLLNGFLEKERRIDRYLTNFEHYLKNPFETFRRLSKPSLGSGDYLMIPPVFFQELSAKGGHECILLIQAIKGKPDCKWRYDVLIEKRG